MSETTPARGASDLDALRAAVQRIEGGESTGLFNDLPPPTTRTSSTKERTSKTSRKRSAPDWAQPDPGHTEAPTAAGKAGGEPDSGPDEDRDADPYAVARQIVLRQLTMAPKSRHQLREKLRQRDCPDEVAEAVLERMTEVGLVDDEKYAEALVRSKQVSRGLSKRALAHELRQKGVDKDTADSVLDEVNPTEEEDRAKALVAGRLPRLRGLDRETVMRRLAGMLARKGYPSGLSFQVIREAIDADPAFRRD